jgi:hypothetical protein
MLRIKKWHFSGLLHRKAHQPKSLQSKRHHQDDNQIQLLHLGVKQHYPIQAVREEVTLVGSNGLKIAIKWSKGRLHEN